MDTDRKDTNIQIGKRLREARRNMNIDKAEIAEVLGVTVEHYRKFEACSTGLSVDKILILYQTYGIDPTYLITGVSSNAMDFNLEYYVANSRTDVEMLECSFDKLHQYPIEYDVYFSGKELLEYHTMHEEVYHLYIFDIEMPQINGLELAKEIRKRDAKALFVFLTSYTHYVMDVFDVSLMLTIVVIGEVEALLSLGVIALNREVTFGDVSESSTPAFFAREIYHPLIDSEKVVSNSISVSKGINIITGSNMSGKSTFMRTIGINLVLAYAGAPVCAKEMRVSLMELYTCMRATDDVFQGKSSFYAEVLRIKTIIDASKGSKPIFVIIDEIFKGTNSIDRITGAKEIIKRLNKSHVMLWVSTHDLELCSLIEEKHVQGNNYHFLETYKDNEILFDYKIKNGKCKSRNAKYILKMAGLFD